MGDDSTTFCQYVGHDEDGNPEGCDSEASVIVRRKKPLTSATGQMEPDKTPVCTKHARYLVSDEVPIAWEKCGSVME